MSRLGVSDLFVLSIVILSFFSLRLWLQVNELRTRREIRRHLPRPSFFGGGLSSWIWSDGHRAVGDAALSRTVLVLRILTMLGAAIFLAVIITA